MRSAVVTMVMHSNNYLIPVPSLGTELATLGPDRQLVAWLLVLCTQAVSMAIDIVLSQHLRQVLSCDSYSSAVEDQTLGDILADIESMVNLQLRGYERRRLEPRGAFLKHGGILHAVYLLKRIIMARFQLLCVSAELENDVEYAFTEFRTICEAVETYNCTVIPKLNKLHHSASIGCRTFEIHPMEFADFTKVVAFCHSERIASRLLPNVAAETVLQEAKFEAAFARALVGIFSTYTNLLNECCPKSTAVYVTEGMFSLSNTSWLNCLIPGGESEGLRLTAQLLVADVWRCVSTALEARNQPLLLSEGLIAQLHQITKLEGLQYHPAVTKSLWYVASHLDQQQSLSHWDSGFELLLASSHRRGYKPSPGKHTTHTTWLLQSQVLPTISNSLTTEIVLPQSSDSTAIANHVDALRLSQPLCAALSASSQQVGVFLLQGLAAALASENLRIAAQLLCVDGPEISRALEGATALAGRACSPMFAFPVCSHLHAMEYYSRSGYSVAHRLSKETKELLAELCTVFHDGWRKRCAEVLKASFPPRKAWKTISHKTHRLTPSGYCSTVIEHILLPVVEAAAHLCEEPQGMFVGLSVAIFVNEFRKTVTSNKKTYRMSAGQQLLTDFRHLRQWLTSEEMGLCAGTSQLLATLPALADVEHGLLLVCGTTDHTSHPPEAMDHLHTYTTYSHLPVFLELAWHSTQDWLNCMA